MTSPLPHRSARQLSVPRRRVLSVLGPCFAFIFTLFSNTTIAAAEINVFAAASLADALKTISTRYTATSGDQLVLNLAASSSLARQIREGAPADVFFSADDAKMNDLAQAGLIETDTRRDLLSNTLVIVVPATDGVAITQPADLAQPAVKRLALAETQTVPAGLYARAYLDQAGLWAQVAAKVVPTENVRACLAAVEAGNADAGIVYKTDALLSKKVRIAYKVPAHEGPPITYPVAVIKGGKQTAAARKLVAYLATPEATAIFTRYGFLRAP